MPNKDDSITLPTPAGIAKFPRLNEPDTKFDKDGVYKATLVLREKDKVVQDFLGTIQEVYNASIAAAKAELKKGKVLKEAGLPIKPHLDENGDEVKGFVEISAKVKASGERKDGSRWEWKPPVVDAKKKAVTANVGGGSELKLMVELKAYNSPSYGAGVSIKLKAVQVLKLVEFGGNAADGFAEEEGYEVPEASKDADGITEEGTEEGADAPAEEEQPKAKKNAKPTAKKAKGKSDF